MATESLGTLSVDISANTQGLSKAVGTADKSLSKLDKTVAKVAAGIAASFVARKLTSGFQAMIAVTANFEKQITRAGAIAGVVGTSKFAELEKAVRGIASATQFTATEVAEGATIMAQAGFTASEVGDGLKKVLQLATAGGTDLATATGIAASTLKGFGLEVRDLGKVNDILATAANSAFQSVEDIGAALKEVAPISAALGISLEETSGAMTLMANKGFTAGRAGNALKIAFASLLKPQDEVATKLKALGFEFEGGSAKITSLSDVLNKLAPIADNTGLLFEIFGNRGATAMQGLLASGGPALDAMTNKLENSAGAAAKVEKALLDTFSGQMDILKSQVESFTIDIGQALLPALRALVDILQGVVAGFQGLGSTTKFVIAVGLAMSTVLVGLLATMVTLAAFLPSIIAGFKLMGDSALRASVKVTVLRTSISQLTKAGAIDAATSKFRALGSQGGKSFASIASAVAKVGPKLALVGVIVLGVTALIASLNELVKFFAEDISRAMESAAKNTREAWAAAVDISKELWEDFSGFIGLLVDLFADGVRSAIPEAWGDAFSAALKTAEEAFNSLLSALGPVGDAMIGVFRSAFSFFVDGIKTVIGWIETAAKFWGKKLGFLGTTPKMENVANIIVDKVTIPGLADPLKKTADAANKAAAALGAVGGLDPEPVRLGGRPTAAAGAPQVAAREFERAGAAAEQQAADKAASIDQAIAEGAEAGLAVAAANQEFADAQLTAGDIIANAGSALLAKTGDFGNVVGSVVEGFKEGGLAGAGAALAVEIISRTEGFQQISESLGTVITSLTESLGPLIGAIAGVVGIVVELLAPIFAILGKILGALTPIVKSIGKLLGSLAPIFEGIVMILEPFVPLIEVLAAALGGIIDIIFTVLSPIFEALGFVLGVVADIITIIIRGMLEIFKGLLGVWNGIVSAIESIFNAIGDFEIFGARPFAFLNDWADTIAEAKISTSALDDAIADLDRGIEKVPEPIADATDEVSDDVTDFGSGLADVTDAMRDVSESLINVPEGFKVATARFAATVAETSAPFDVSGFDAVGGRGGQVVGRTTSIGAVNLVNSDPREFWEQLKEIIEEENFFDTGTPIRSTPSFALPAEGGRGQ